MIIDFKGEALVGASIEISSKCLILNARLVRCFIDDAENAPFDKQMFKNCEFESCTFRSTMREAPDLQL